LFLSGHKSRSKSWRRPGDVKVYRPDEDGNPVLAETWWGGNPAYGRSLKERQPKRRSQRAKVPRWNPSAPSSRNTKLPFVATVTANGRTYEVEVGPAGNRFLGWIGEWK
jgi:hypothetical protein